MASRDKAPQRRDSWLHFSQHDTDLPSSNSVFDSRLVAISVKNSVVLFGLGLIQQGQNITMNKETTTEYNG